MLKKREKAKKKNELVYMRKRGGGKGRVESRQQQMLEWKGYVLHTTRARHLVLLHHGQFAAFESSVPMSDP